MTVGEPFEIKTAATRSKPSSEKWQITVRTGDLIVHHKSATQEEADALRERLLAMNTRPRR